MLGIKYQALDQMDFYKKFILKVNNLAVDLLKTFKFRETQNMLLVSIYNLMIYNGLDGTGLKLVLD